MKKLALIATVAIGVSPAAGEIILKRPDATFNGNIGGIIKLNRPESVFPEGRGPVITRKQSISDPAQSMAIEGLLEQKDIDPKRMPVPKFFNLPDGYRPLMGLQEEQIYVYTDDPEIARGTINSFDTDPHDPDEYELGIQLFDDTGEVIEQDFQNGSAEERLKVFRKSREPADIRRFDFANSALAVYFLFDRSGSMSDTGAAQMAFFNGLLSDLPAGSDCGLAFFTTEVVFQNNGVYQACKSLKSMGEAEFVSLLPFGGGTDIYTGLKETFLKIDAQDHRQRLVIIVSDGHQRSWISKEELIEGRPAHTKVIVLRPDNYDADALEGLVDFEVVLSSDIRRNKNAYKRVIETFSDAISDSLKGQMFLRPSKGSS